LVGELAARHLRFLVWRVIAYKKCLKQSGTHADVFASEKIGSKLADLILRFHQTWLVCMGTATACMFWSVTEYSRRLAKRPLMVLFGMGVLYYAHDWGFRGMDIRVAVAVRQVYFYSVIVLYTAVRSDVGGVSVYSVLTTQS